MTGSRLIGNVLKVAAAALVAVLIFHVRWSHGATSGYFGPRVAGAEEAICQVFGPRCREALRVAWCESRYSTTSSNGQYLGLFQMGEWERRTYGHATGLSRRVARLQSEAAYRYFVASGRDWSPWSCKPWSS